MAPLQNPRGLPGGPRGTPLKNPLRTPGRPLEDSMAPPPLENPVVPLEEPVALDSIPRLQVGKPRLEI